MKRITLVMTLFFITAVLFACGNGGAGTGMTDNEENLLNTIDNVQPDTMSNDEDFTFDYNSTRYDDYMRAKMVELPFTEFQLDVTFQDGKEYEAEIDHEPNEPIFAQVEDEINEVILRGKDAFDHIFFRVKELDITGETSKQDVINQVVKAFGLADDYVELDIEILFNDGKEINIEDKNKQ